MTQIRKGVLLRLPMIGLAVLGLLYVGLVLYGRWALDRADREAFELVANQAARAIRAQIEDRADRFQEVSAREMAHGPLDRDGSVKALRNALGQFREVSLFDTFGSLRASSSDAPVDPLGFDAVFDHALNGRSAVTLPFSYDAEESAVMILIPLLDALGQVQSVLTGILPLDELWAGLETADLKQGAAVALLDVHGRVFADSGRLAERSSGLMHRAPVLSHDGTIQGQAAGRSYVYISSTMKHGAGIAGPDWTVLVLRPYTALGVLLGRYSLVYALLGLLALACAMAVGLRLMKRVYAPLRRAVEAAEKVDQGQLDVRVPEEGPAELATIASAFNHMTAEVRYHRHTMTTMVEARTRSLERAQKAQERIMEQLRASYESADEGFLVVDILSGEILQHNKRVSLLFGIAEEDLHALSGDGFREMLKTMFCEPIDFENRWNYYNENPGEEGREEWQLKRPRAMTLSVYTAPVRSEQKNVIMSRLWMFRDVTEIREREEQLRQSQRMDAMSHIAGSVAHDFNNLLTVIVGNLSLAQLECSPDAPEMEYLVAAQDATTEAGALVKQLQEFSHGSRMQTESVDVNRMASDVHQALWQSMEHRVHFHLDLDEKLWDACADPDQLQRVFTNVVMERFDSLPSGGDLWISTANVLLTREDATLPEERAQGEYVRVLFSSCAPDSLPAGEEEPFEPVLGAARGRAALGLFMAYGIMVKHAGWMASLGGGEQTAALAVYIPRSEQRSTPMPSDSKPAEAEPCKGAVMIVDDESGVRRIAVSVLKRAGLATFEAADGEEAVRIYEEHQAEIGIVLLDLSMPKLSGRETLKALKQIDVDLPILLCSGYPVAPDDFERETGFRPNGIVQKPFDIRALPSQVRAAMGDPGGVSESVG